MKNIALIGFQACGKTSVGQELSRYLKCPFIDTDRLIEAHHSGWICSDIFKTYGETYFREQETLAIQELNPSTKTIIATGGGSLLNPANGLYLKQHSHLIYLKISLSILKERILKRRPLPAYLDLVDPEGSFTAIYQERAALYEHWADAVVDVAEQTPKEICDLIGERYGF